MDEWLDFERKSLMDCIPVKGIIELTYQCNFRCVICYLGEKRERTACLTREQCGHIFTSLREAGALALTFTGGELFLNPEADSILSDARERGFAIRIFTNGSLITPERADLLRELTPLSVDVSLYGADENVYEKVTGKKSHFSSVITGLELMKERGLTVNVKIAVNKENFRGLEKMKTIAESFGFTSVLSPLLSPSDCGDMTPCSYMLQEEDLKEYYRLWGHKPVPLKREKDDLVCTSGRNAFVISPEGDVFPCIQIRNSVGNVFDKDFKEIWNDSPSQALKEIRNLRFGDMSECSECGDSSVCFFCPGLALLTEGKLTDRDKVACILTEAMKQVFEDN